MENASIPAEDIVGFRSPHLQTGGNAQYRLVGPHPGKDHRRSRRMSCDRSLDNLKCLGKI